MEHGGWIDLHEFSTKYGVSLSTLRRRIRGKSISFKLEKGRYWLPDTEDVMSAAPLFSRAGEPNIPQQTIRSTTQMNELEFENRRLKAQIAELNTLVGVLEAELSQREEATSPNQASPEYNA